MLAEGRMQAERGPSGEDLGLARSQALKASGANGPGLIGALHGQAAHIAGPLRALPDQPAAPLGQALAAVSWALVGLLQAMNLAEPDASHADAVADALAGARQSLADAESYLGRLDEQTAAAEGLAAVIVAATKSMYPPRAGNATGYGQV